jgi:hypothetical protein
MTQVEFLEYSGVIEAMWPNFKDWVHWFDSNGLMGTVRDKDGEIHGVALARCIPHGVNPDHYVHSENGDDIFVDLCATSGIRNAELVDPLKGLLLILWDRFGPRKRIIFNRLGKPKEYDYMKFMRKALA